MILFYFDKKNSTGVMIYDPNIFTNIGHIDYMVIDSCLSEGSYEMKSLGTRQNLFEWDWEKFQGSLSENFIGVLASVK